MFVFTAFAVKHKTELRYFPFPLIILEMLLQPHQGAPVVNPVDWSVLLRTTGDSTCQSTIQAGSQSLPADLWHRIVSEALWVLSKSTVLPKTSPLCGFVPLPIFVLYTLSPCLTSSPSLLDLRPFICLCCFQGFSMFSPLIWTPLIFLFGEFYTEDRLLKILFRTVWGFHLEF